MYNTDHAGVGWLGFVADQVLWDHEITSVAIIQVLRGQIRLTTATEQVLGAVNQHSCRPMNVML